jgi:hypothetical protein
MRVRGVGEHRVVPLPVPVVALQPHRSELPVGDPDAQRVAALVQLGLDPQPRAGPVAAINSRITSWETSGLPRQFMEMWLNSRCSILFHLEVPGAKWQTVTARPVASRGVAAQLGGEVAAAAGTQDADVQVAQAGHGPWGVVGADLAGVPWLPMVSLHVGVGDCSSGRWRSSCGAPLHGGTHDERERPTIQRGGAGRAVGPTARLVRSRAASRARRVAAGSDRSARAVSTGRIRKLGCSTQVGT